MNGRSALRRALGLALLVLIAGPAAGAQALDAPELLYREGVSESEPQGPWLPLEGARIAGLGFIVGTRAQSPPPGDTRLYRRLSMLTVPDGHPDQGSAFDATYPCQEQTARTAPAGTEIILGLARFEGPGSYTVRLAVDVPSHGATSTSCADGPATTATFTIDPVLQPVSLVRSPLLLSRRDDPFVELVAVAPPVGGAAQIQCARGGIVQPDGSIHGSPTTPVLSVAVVRRDIAVAGRWTCVARARSTYGNISDGEYVTRWSPPVSFDTVVPFSARLTPTDKIRPRFTLVYDQMPPGSEGGRVTLRISAGANCPRVRTRTLRARVSRGLRARFVFTLPEKDKATWGVSSPPRGVDYYGWRFTFAFAGTKLVRPARSTAFAAIFPKRSTYADQLLLDQPVARCIRTT